MTVYIYIFMYTHTYVSWPRERDQKKQIGIKQKIGKKNITYQKKNEKGRKEGREGGRKETTLSPPPALLYLNPSYISWG